MDEEEEEKPKLRSRSNILDLEREQREERKEVRETPKVNTYTPPSYNPNNYSSVARNNTPSEPKEEVRVFKPSPVISPVYGVLDKNYKKEEIIERQQAIRHNPEEMNYDSVRRKAYGTLEDELENTLSKIASNEKLEEESKNLESSAKENDKSIEDLILLNPKIKRPNDIIEGERVKIV